MLYRSDLDKLDVTFRRLARQVVGPPSNVDWGRPWHEVLHDWHLRLNRFVASAGLRTWSEKALRQYWSFAAYIAGLPGDRWLRRVVAWSPMGQMSQGRPFNKWHDRLQCFCNQAGLGHWLEAASDTGAWEAMSEDFVSGSLA